jgi:hypothetical protein
MDWKSILNDDENGELKVGWGFDRIYATLETSGKYIPIYYYGEGDTVEEALEALEGDDDPR